MRKKTQYIVVNEIYKTIYCGYPQKRAWNVWYTENVSFLCGVTITFSIHQSGLSALRGSSSNTSSTAPPILCEYTLYYRIVCSKARTHDIRKSIFRKFRARCGSQLKCASQVMEEDLK